MSDAVVSRYLTGVFAPVEQELTAFDLPVRGQLPPELDGRYLRNGPNPLLPPDPASYHWFLGDGMVHGVRLRDGRAEWYRNRWVRSTEVSAALGEPPAPGERYGGMDNPNTSVIGHAGRIWALVEAGARPAELSGELDTVCHTDLDGTLPHGFTAHPQLDPDTGELHAVNYHWARPELMEYVVVGVDGRVRHRVDVPVPGNPMVHSCAMTERSMVLLDLPCTFNIDAAMSGARFPYLWDPDYGARVGILPKGGQPDQVVWHEVEPCYVYHPLNAFDDGEAVVVDVVRHPKTFARDTLGPNDGAPVLWRWRIEPGRTAVIEEQLDDYPVEFPRVDERVVGKRHAVGWATGYRFDQGDVLFEGDELVRYDATGTREVISLGRGRATGEFSFVPRSPDAAPDDGWYVVLSQELASDTGELVVLDAADPAAGPVATVELPGRIPLGFHGNWIPAGP